MAFFTNHSLRRTGTSRLFQAGVDQKLVKEYSGHRSDALDQYQITSEHQKEMISEVLAGPKPKQVEISDVQNEVKETKACTSDAVSKQNNQDLSTEIACDCNKRLLKISETSQVASLINDIVSNRQGGKTVVKIEIEFCN